MLTELYKKKDCRSLAEACTLSSAILVYSFIHFKNNNGMLALHAYVTVNVKYVK